MVKHLPFSPNLEHLKKQAKHLVKGHKAGQVDAFLRIKASFPRLENAAVHEITTTDFSLCNAQLVVAREYGFETWNTLVEAIEKPEATMFQDAFVGENPSLQWIEKQLGQLAPSEVPVLLVGERGTGKGMVARAIHRLSPRRDGPFFQIDCSAMPDALVISALFGHEERAFTGARARRLGKAELAQGGTIFLDELGDLSPETQKQLMTLLSEGSFERIGGDEVLQSDVRVIVATDQDLEALVAAGRLRRDLADLLLRVRLALPALRQRTDDIADLAAHFMAQMAQQLNKATPKLNNAAQAALRAHAWPGNMRELEYKVQRAVAECEAPVIGAEDIVL